jgi:hypothetical protein
MLSGEHRNVNYDLDMNPSINRRKLYNSNPLGPSYDPPFKELFLNDTIFEPFLKELQSDLMASQHNTTRHEIYFSGYPYLDFNTSGKPETRLGRKPILLKGPDF